VKFKHNTLVGLANGAGTKWQKFKAGAGSIAGGAGSAKTVASNVSKLATSDNTSSSIRNSVTSFCRELCPGLDPNHIFTVLHLGSVATFATELTPFVGVISSGGKAVVGWIGVAKRAWDRMGLAETRFAFAPGDPEAAFDAVIALLDREIKSEAGRATNRTVAFTGKALAAFADGGAVTGPVIGLLEILADIFQTIIEYVRDYKECLAANELLRVGALNLEIFSVCPILGCYFILVQDHSTIINFAASLHLLAASPGAYICEYPITNRAARLQNDREPSPMMTELARHDIQVEGGIAIVPNTPGLGLEIDSAALQRYTLR
jgi:hypothetical protein